MGGRFLFVGVLALGLVACQQASAPKPDLATAYRIPNQGYRMPEQAAPMLFPSPLAGPAKITSDFGRRRGSRGSHKGIDLAAPRGTPIQAPAGALVREVGYDRNGYGRYVSLVHLDGFVTLYAHLQETDVSVGQSIRQGQAIGTVGTSGNATGPHLHLEVRQHGILLDPKTAFDFRGLKRQPVFAAVF